MFRSRPRLAIASSWSPPDHQTGSQHLRTQSAAFFSCQPDLRVRCTSPFERSTCPVATILAPNAFLAAEASIARCFRISLVGTTHSVLFVASRLESLPVSESIRPLASATVSGSLPATSNGSIAICFSRLENNIPRVRSRIAGISSRLERMTRKPTAPTPTYSTSGGALSLRKADHEDRRQPLGGLVSICGSNSRHLQMIRSQRPGKPFRIDDAGRGRRPLETAAPTGEDAANGCLPVRSSYRTIPSE